MSVSELTVKPDPGRNLEQLLESIPVEASNSFWKFAAKDFQFIRGQKRKSLSEAIHSLERNGSKTSISGLPIAVRMISDAELSRSVLKLRRRLCGNKFTKDNLKWAFCRWVGETELAALLAVLDAMGCAHDENGMQTNGIPVFSASSASAALRSLLDRFSPESLIIVCAGLLANDERWANLGEAYDQLQDLLQERANALIEEPLNADQRESDKPTTARATPINAVELERPIDRAMLTEIKLASQQLQDHLRDALSAIESRRIPKIQSIILSLESLDRTWSALSKQLGIETEELIEIEAALEKHLATGEAEGLREKCRRIRHSQDVAFDLSAVRERLVLIDAGFEAVAPNLQALHGIRNLVQLIEQNPELTEDVAEALYEVVKSEFGSKIAMAALRGNLEISVQSIEQNNIEPQSKSALTSFEPLAIQEAPEVQEGNPEESSSPMRFDDNVRPILSNELATCVPLKNEATECTESHTLLASETDADSRSEVTSTALGAEDEFVTFRLFQQTHWVDENGHVGSAPWAQESFFITLAEAIPKAWADGFLARAYIGSLAQNQGAKNPSLHLSELEHADRLLTNPSNVAIGIDRNRVAYLRDRVSDGKAKPDFAVSVMLEALRPTLPSTLDRNEINQIVSLAKYKDVAISDVVTFLLNGWASNINPIDVLRSRVNNSETADSSTLEKLVRSAQDNLRRKINSYWQAAGGKILRRHCQRAWSEFVQTEIVPLREELAPPASTENIKRLSPSVIQQRVDKLVKGYRRIMDGGEVKYDDRAAADHAAEQIASAAIQLQDAVQRLKSVQQQNRMAFDGCPYEQATRLVGDQTHKGSDDLCVRMFRAVLTNDRIASPLRMGVNALLEQPNLVRCTNPEDFFDKGILDGQIDPSCITDYLMACVLTNQIDVQRYLPAVDKNDVLRALHDQAVSLSRMDILAALSPVALLQSHERTLIYNYALQVGDVVFEKARELERLWGIQEELLVSSSGVLKECVDEARNLARPDSSETGQTNSITNSMLAQEWLSKLIPLAQKECDSAKAARIAIAKERSLDFAAEVASCFDAENYRGVTVLLNGGRLEEVATVSSVRRTEWRQDAIIRYSSARQALEREFKGKTDEQERLVEMWLGPRNEPSPRETLERLFYSVISGEAGRSVAENQHRFKSLSELRDHSKVRKTIIHCSAIRDYFRRAKLNPSFLPQLAEFSQIVLSASPVSPTKSGGMLDDWARVVNAEHPRALVVFLEPGISGSRRDEICSGFRKRGLAAALIDDIDLCRLLECGKHAEGQDFIPLLEIALEQLSLESISPFSVQDGQHVRIETYVGRAQEARQVALTGNYTRVFSGRKLGKSALLKYIAATYDQERLPSGNTLHVFFITIAGGESESWLVQWIIDEMTSRFDVHESASSTSESPPERFSNYMQRLMQECPRVSILIILDEADAFIEGQLARYDQDRESSLSFRMMKGLPAKVDSQDLHRIRIVFSGYRVTNTRDAVWANAGDVLILRPLTEMEAVHFLRGMLAKAGVDLGIHGPSIARRCGFQPAVLIRFGDSLLKRLSRNSFSATRESLRVTEDEVRATLHDQAVLDEIRTVVNNNFQGNRVGAVVFGATLLALKDLEPGLALRSGPAQVLEKLREIDPEIDWLEKIDPSPVAEIERNLQDFIDRGLLRVSDAARFGVREYRLRFPHFLPVLTQQSEVALEVRQQIQIIRAGSLHRRLSVSVIAESALDTVRYWFSQESVDICKIVVVAGTWPAALIDEKRGIPDRLGCDRRATISSPDEASLKRSITNGVRVFTRVSGQSWQQYLHVANPRPIVLLGGLDLLRETRRQLLSSSDLPVEVATLGRLPEVTLMWWFERARALQFESTDAIASIIKGTDGIPFLVAAIDRLLNKSDGDDVTLDEMNTVMLQFEQALPDLARTVADGNLEYGLANRELELLKMAVRFASEVAEEFDIEREFAADWNAIFGEIEGVIPPLLGDDDRLAMDVLIDAGFLHRVGSAPGAAVSSMGRIRLPADSVTVKIVSILEADNVR
ncbi:hypothetical protein GJ697_05900 [Pseudoduganella sp. FT25W]|uniref:Uncharacterized protein n=1 Tax=Duganella alba TaxID=2666081 RepID=A0A6L5QC58_9BURK|nr:hypothetical protein [Duganella alba]MRX07364.1 hypothetical protein [Duganella alba]MRX19466.1 hypothetical protein [Duganella alba]